MRKVKVNWVKVFKNGPSRNCGRQPLKNFKRYGLLEIGAKLTMKTT